MRLPNVLLTRRIASALALAADALETQDLDVGHVQALIALAREDMAELRGDGPAPADARRPALRLLQGGRA